MAYKVLKCMIAMGLAPDVWTWNLVIKGLCQQNKLNDAMDIVENMSARSDVKPDVVTFTTQIRGWCKRGDMEMATKVFDLASKMNVVPNDISYNTVIRGWCERGREDRAIKVMKQ